MVKCIIEVISMMRNTAVAAVRRERVAAAWEGKLTLYRLFWLFVLASFLGDLAETAFWLITRGELTSRSSLLYGPFSLVWGCAVVLLTLVFHKVDDQNPGSIFLLGAILGGAYEYLCSLLQEWAFGACFWDYRHLPFNLDGRVNLVFCLFWGLAAILWVYCAYPALFRLVERIPPAPGRYLAGVLAVFLALSTVLSAAALWRMNQRHDGVPASGPVTAFLDEQYPDSRLKARYPNMGILDEINWYD